jgi:hypothetical protein
VGGRSFSAFAASLALIGLLAIQACFEQGRQVEPEYLPSAQKTTLFTRAQRPPAFSAGDWDENHQWHDRDWWVQNRRAWVALHHPDWLESQTSSGAAHN